jgi:hypothetical protein
MPEAPEEEVRKEMPLPEFSIAEVIREPGRREYGFFKKDAYGKCNVGECQRINGVLIVKDINGKLTYSCYCSNKKSEHCDLPDEAESNDFGRRENLICRRIANTVKAIQRCFYKKNLLSA